MFSAKRLLGSMVGSGLRRATGGLVGGSEIGGSSAQSGGIFSGTSATGLAAGAVGVAAAGGLAYAAYRHFQGGAAPGGAMPAGAVPGGGGIGGMLSGLVGTTGGMQSGSPGGGAPNMGGFDPYAHQAKPATGPASPAGWPQSPPPAPQPLPTWDAPTAPQPAFSPASSPTGAPSSTPEDATALLLVRAMIAAANVDGRIDPTERAQILQRVTNSGIDDADRAVLEKELDAPRPLRELLTAVDSPETARQFYMVSLLAISADTEEEKSYLQTLPTLLGLSPEAAKDVAQLLGF